MGKVESEQKGATHSALGNSCPLLVVCYSTADHSQVGKFSHTQWWQFSRAVHNGQPYRGSTTTTVLTALNLYSYNTFHLMLLTTTWVYMAAAFLRNLTLAHILPVEHQPVGHWSIKCHKVHPSPLQWFPWWVDSYWYWSSWRHTSVRTETLLLPTCIWQYNAKPNIMPNLGKTGTSP